MLNNTLDIPYYKQTIEWQSLNKIWKTLTANQKLDLESDFKSISIFLAQHTKHKDINEYSYLSSLDNETIDFVKNIISLGYPNLYHSLMAILGQHSNIRDANTLIQYYTTKYQYIRPEIFKEPLKLAKLCDLCIERAMSKSWW